jgi:hypothetical protein
MQFVLRLLFNTFLDDETMSGKQGLNSFSPVFVDEESNSLFCVIKPFKDKETLKDMIEVRSTILFVHLLSTQSQM